MLVAELVVKGQRPQAVPVGAPHVVRHQQQIQEVGEAIFEAAPPQLIQVPQSG